MRAEPSLSLVLGGIDRSDGSPIYQQLYASLRDAILSGRLARGRRIPASRALADELSISRNTVVAAYDQLFAEGYLETRSGSGSFVTRELPDAMTTVGAGARAGARRASPGPSARGHALAAVSATISPDGPPRAFRTGAPALDAFPVELWARLAQQAWKSADLAQLGYGHAAGYQPLRAAIADYLRVSRAVACEPEQVLVVNGSQEALFLTALTLLDPGEQVWFEDPGYRGARTALLAAGAVPVPIGIDREGLRVDEGERRAPAARAIYVTPSHQYPLGVTMSVSRRLDLLAWAHRHGAWILEDDYDSEFRYEGRPLASLQGLDPDGRVVYTGTFSKVLCPALRVGYMVVPPSLVDTLSKARSLVDRQSPTIDQVVLARFLRDGHFARHIRRMRQLYRERQDVLVNAARQELAGLLDVEPQPAGLHLVGWLPADADDVAAAARAVNAGVEVSPVANYYAGEAGPAPERGGGTPSRYRPGLVMGYAGSDPVAIRRGVKDLARALDRR
jgi:GntR family transcriptional regulator/MocR family aminotransferase